MEKTRREYPDIAPAGPTFARAVRVDGTLYISGCTARGTDAQGGPAIEQFKVVWDRLIRIVEAEGGTATDIVKITTFVTDMREWFSGVRGTAGRDVRLLRGPESGQLPSGDHRPGPARVGR